MIIRVESDPRNKNYAGNLDPELYLWSAWHTEHDVLCYAIRISSSINLCFIFYLPFRETPKQNNEQFKGIKTNPWREPIAFWGGSYKGSNSIHYWNSGWCSWRSAPFLDEHTSALFKYVGMKQIMIQHCLSSWVTDNCKYVANRETYILNCQCEFFF